MQTFILCKLIQFMTWYDSFPVDKNILGKKKEKQTLNDIKKMIT